MAKSVLRRDCISLASTAAEAANNRQRMNVAGNRNEKRTTGGRRSDPHRGPRKADHRRPQERPTQRAAGPTQEIHRHEERLR